MAAVANNTLEVVDLTAGKVIKSLTGFKDTQDALFLDGDFNKLYVSSLDGHVRVFQGESFWLVQDFKVEPDPIYNLRHVFCTRLSWVAPDAVVQHAMRHSSPETKRFYQLGLAHQVREHLERVNQKTYEERDPLQIRDSGSRREQVQQLEVCK